MKISHLFLVLTLALLATFATGCQTMKLQQERPESAIRDALDRQVRAWNAGNLAGFMEIYDRSEQTRFASGNEVTVGWMTVFERYRKRYGTGAGMGTLSFTNIETTSLGADAALTFGRWHLKRDNETSTGLFTLLFRKRPEGWRIVHDHTSSAAKP